MPWSGIHLVFFTVYSAFSRFLKIGFWPDSGLRFEYFLGVLAIFQRDRYAARVSDGKVVNCTASPVRPSVVLLAGFAVFSSVFSGRLGFRIPAMDKQQNRSGNEILTVSRYPTSSIYYLLLSKEENFWSSILLETCQQVWKSTHLKQVKGRNPKLPFIR
jgi:hypothetical protein